MRPITPNLWFDTQAEDAAGFYCSLFEDSRITAVHRYGPDNPGPEGSVMLVEFELMGRAYEAINGGPQFPFTEAVSFEVPCDSQDEIDQLWAALADDGQPGPCGWIKDRYGLSWQVVPVTLQEMMRSGDAEAVQRVTQVFLSYDGVPMNLAELRAAFDGERV